MLIELLKRRRGRIKGDYEKSRVLQNIAQKYQLQGALRQSYIKVADSIASEYERNRVLPW